MSHRELLQRQFIHWARSNCLPPVLEQEGFSEAEIFVETLRLRFPSFDVHFEPIEQGAGSVGAEFVVLSTCLRQNVRGDVRREQEGPTMGSGPVAIEIAILFATGIK